MANGANTAINQIQRGIAQEKEKRERETERERDRERETERESMQYQCNDKVRRPLERE
jgi:hypothetical protein